MPTVPVYENFQVSPGAGPQARFSAPEVLPAGARQAQQIGQGLQQFGGEMGKLALGMQQQADQARLDDAMNQAVKAKLVHSYDPAQGYLRLRGEDALKRPDGRYLGDEYGERMQKQLDAIESGLGNEAQKLAFRRQSAQIMQQFRAGIAQHVSREHGVYQASVHAGTILTAREQLTLASGDPFDGVAVQQSVDAIKAAVMQRDRGLAGQQIEANIRAELSPGHYAAIQAAVDGGKPDFAREYFGQRKEEMSQADRLRASHLLDAGDVEQRAQDRTDALLAKHKGDVAAALSDARATLAGKDEDAVVSRIKAIDAERSVLRERGQRDAADQAWQVYARTGSLSKIPPSVLQAMDGRDVETLRDAHRRAIEHARGKIDTEARDSAFYALYGDDEQVARMRPEQIASMRAQGFTAAQVGQLVRRHQTLAKEAESVQVDRQQLNEAHLKNGIDLGTAGLTQRGSIEAAVEAEVYQEQQRLGRKLSRDEKQKIINRQFVEVESHWKRTGGLLGGQTGTDKKRYWEVQNKSSVRIPDDARRRIEADLKRAGVRGITEDQMRALYLEMAK